jgi:hypothetical protein
MKKFLLASFFSLALGSVAQAQWQNVTYSLKAGWNSIYLHGDANHDTIDNILVGSPTVQEIWRWNPNPNPAQFRTSSVLPSASTPEWSVWIRGNAAQTTLGSLLGQTAYLVKCSGTVSDSHQVTIPQRILPPRSTWMRGSANFMGFPALAGVDGPTISSYFSTFPAAIASNARVYKYVGGDIGPGNPLQIYSPSSEKLDRNQAYWFEASVVGDFSGALEVKTSDADGVVFGRSTAFVNVRLRNRTSSAMTVTLAPEASAPVPVAYSAPIVPGASVPAVTVTPLASVPLIRRTYSQQTSASTGQLETVVTDNAVTGAFTETVAPLSELQVTLGVDRSKMTGTADTVYASFLRIKDSGKLVDVLLPVSARTTSLSGLWVGDVMVSQVQPLARGAVGPGTSRPFPLRVIIHVDNAGVARLLSQVFIGKIGGSATEVGLCTKENGLQSNQKASAVRLSSAALPLDTVLPSSSGVFALGSFVDFGPVGLAFNDPVNPFVHTYHPDHDNRDARFAALGAGVESFTVSRSMRFAFSSSSGLLAPDADSASWGSTKMVGSYVETIRGLRKDDISASGTFELRRVSEIAEIKIN